MRLVSFLLFILFFQVCFAHNPNETHTSISLKDHHLHLTIDLPRSVSDALRKAYPSYFSQNKKEFLPPLEKYISENLVVIKDEKIIQYNLFTPPRHDDDHSIVIQLVYPVTNYTNLEIENKLLFNTQPKQVNYHTIYFPDGSMVRFETTHNNDRFRIIPESSHNYGIFPLILGVVLIVIFFRAYKRRKKRNSL